MTATTFALNTELRPLLEAIAAQKAAPLWVELIPAGKAVAGRDGREWLNANPKQIVDAFAKNAAYLPIDLEHSTEHKAPKGEPAPAVGWLKALQAREGGAIWGLVEWTDEGRALLEAKAYKYLSPVFSFNTANKQITQLYSAGLTNQPNLHLTALNQRINNFIGEEAMSVSPAICTALGLPAQATEEQTVSAINQLQTDKDKALNTAANNPSLPSLPSLEKFVPRADHDAALNRAQNAETKLQEIQDTTLNLQIEDELDKAQQAGTITPATLAYHRACCKQAGGLQRFQEFVKSAPKFGADTDLDNKAANKHRKGLSEEDKAACRLLGVAEDEFTTTKEAA